MEVFRLTKKQYSKTLDGKGAALFGNRWNSKGTEMIYTSESRALAMAEVIAHISLATLPEDFVMLQIEIPDEISIKLVNKNLLAKNWNHFPHITNTQKIGDKFILENEYCILKVPSAIVKGDYNILINPFHKDFQKVKIKKVTDFPFDVRLFKV